MATGKDKVQAPGYLGTGSNTAQEKALNDLDKQQKEANDAAKDTAGSKEAKDTAGSKEAKEPKEIKDPKGRVSQYDDGSQSGPRVPPSIAPFARETNPRFKNE